MHPRLGDASLRLMTRMVMDDGSAPWLTGSWNLDSKHSIHA